MHPPLRYKHTDRKGRYNQLYTGTQGHEHTHAAMIQRGLSLSLSLSLSHTHTLTHTHVAKIDKELNEHIGIF